MRFSNGRRPNSTLAYGKVDTGYKAGGFNTTGTASSTPYGPETATNYELGLKQALFDNRVRLSGAAFYEDYKGYQASIAPARPAPNTGVAGIQNAGNASAERSWRGMLRPWVNPIGKIQHLGRLLVGVFKRFECDAARVRGERILDRDFLPTSAGKNADPGATLEPRRGLRAQRNLPGDAGLMARIQSSFRTAQYFRQLQFPLTPARALNSVSDAMLVLYGSQRPLRG